MAVSLLIEGYTSRIICIKNNKYIHLDIKEALEIKKEFDLSAYKISDILSI